MAGRRDWARGRTHWIVDILGLYRGTGIIGMCSGSCSSRMLSCGGVPCTISKSVC